jgi:hypothetical protein
VSVPDKWFSAVIAEGLQRLAAMRLASTPADEGPGARLRGLDRHPLAPSRLARGPRRHPPAPGLHRPRQRRPPLARARRPARPPPGQAPAPCPAQARPRPRRSGPPRCHERPHRQGLALHARHHTPETLTMRHTFSTASYRKLLGVRPELVAVATLALDRSPLDFRVTEGLRTLSRQQQLVKEGASRTMNSRHLTGHAIDVVALIGGKSPAGTGRTTSSSPVPSNPPPRIWGSPSSGVATGRTSGTGRISSSTARFTPTPFSPQVRMPPEPPERPLAPL